MIGVILSLALGQTGPHVATHQAGEKVEVTLPELVAATGVSGEAPDPADVAAAKLPSTWSASFFTRAKHDLDEMFFDFPSSRFRDVRVGVRTSHRILCGTVNAKNRMGGYVGWRHLLMVETVGGFDIEIEAEPTYKIRHYCLGPTAWASGDQTARVAP